MFQSLEARPPGELQRVITGPSYTDALGSAPHPARGPVRDQDVPLFSLLRSTIGLPIDDARWWPARPVRRPGWFATSRGVRPADARTPRPAAWTIGGAVVPVVGIAPPTLDLLERTLAGLRAWTSTTGGEERRSLGRHAQAVPQA